MVKYRLSTSGMSCSCSRVTSPEPARSTLITSAPNHASNCVQVGPDCTCVKSRMRTPSNALPMGVSGPSLVHGLILGSGRVFPRIYPDVDHGRATQTLHRLACPAQCRRDLCRVAHLLAIPTEHLGELAEGHIAQQIAHVAALLAILRKLSVADLVHRGVIADDRDVRYAKAICRLHVEARHAERAIAVIAQHLLVRMREPGGNRETGADAE